MMAEGFLEHLGSYLKDVIKVILKEIVESLGNQVPVFEPDKGQHFQNCVEAR